MGPLSLSRFGRSAPGIAALDIRGTVVVNLMHATQAASLQYPLHLEPALEVVNVPTADGEENAALRNGPPLDTRVLSVSMLPSTGMRMYMRFHSRSTRRYSGGRAHGRQGKTARP
jgi:hypothetical protein